ncbi:extended synaptotagmin-1-like [Coccinella septempunctata]|uniref:extended synaptotagmin-1-like n=1 Tax=Coccinella septempunctata TaxID=41139 RepID=UPI001D08D279|nr:extended synaptotagmin-1-like [Coccinella septempunctata]
MSFHSDEAQVTTTPCPNPSLLHSSLRVLFSFIWKSTVACYCYFLGLRNWSVIWIAVPLLGSVVLDVFSSNTSRKRNLNKLRSTIDERELIHSHFKELPAWVFFPDIERVEWFNKILRQLWPTMNNFTRSFIQETLEPELRTTMDSYMLKGFYFQRIELGSISPKITGVKVYDRTGRNEIILDLYIFYGGDCEFLFGVSGMNGGIKDFQIEGTMRVIMKPLIPTVPIIGGIKYFFIDNPDIDFCLTGVTGILEIPGVRTQFRNVIESVVNSMLVLPNMCVVNLSDAAEVISYLRTPQPKGVLRVNVMEGKNLIPQDINGLSDPYVIIRVGAQEVRSQTINYSLNPVWNFQCEFIITELQGQKLVFHVWDEDYGKSDPMGHASFDVSSAKAARYIDTWLTLEEVAHGSIHVELTWFNLSTSVRDLSDTLDENNMLGVPLNSAVLTVFVDSANDLPMKTGLPTPVAELKVGNVTKTTQQCLKTADPKWDEGFCFLVPNPQNNSLELKVMDVTMKRQIGQLEFKIKVLLERKNMRMARQPFKLIKSGEKSEITMTLSLKIMTINDVTVSQIFFFWILMVKMLTLLSKNSSLLWLAIATQLSVKALNDYMNVSIRHFVAHKNFKIRLKNFLMPKSNILNFRVEFATFWYIMSLKISENIVEYN